MVKPFSEVTYRNLMLEHQERLDRQDSCKIHNPDWNPYAGIPHYSCTKCGKRFKPDEARGYLAAVEDCKREQARVDAWYAKHPECKR